MSQVVTVEGRRIGPGEKVFVIAEAGVNHDGDLTQAHRLVDVAAQAGADAVKFQTFDPAALVSATAGSTPYQVAAGGPASQQELLRALTLPATAWSELAAHAREAGLVFLSTPFDDGSAHLLIELGLPALKVSSGELTNHPMLRRFAALGVPLLVSTGMGSAEEVAGAVTAAAAAPGLVLFHCVSAYPAPPAEANLRAIPAMAERHGVPVGWSDHTPGSVTAVAAVALGASILEKHVTTDRTRPGPDHAASLEPEEFAGYVDAVAQAQLALGDGVKRRVPSEEENAGLVRRSWHAAVDLEAGQVLGPEHLVALRPEAGITPSVDLTGRVLARPLAAGEPVTVDALTPADRPA